MQTYVGTKIVNAAPMSREEYNDLQGWEMPKGQNGADEGYLVEYVGSAPNHDDFDSYISWSPKEEFDKAYLILNTELEQDYQVRMVAELTQLEAKVQKLGAYITSDKFGELDPRKADLLRRQMDYMNMYTSILTQRVGLEQSEE